MIDPNKHGILLNRIAMRAGYAAIATMLEDCKQLAEEIDDPLLREVSFQGAAVELVIMLLASALADSAPDRASGIERLREGLLRVPALSFDAIALSVARLDLEDADAAARATKGTP